MTYEKYIAAKYLVQIINNIKELVDIHSQSVELKKIEESSADNFTFNILDNLLNFGGYQAVINEIGEDLTKGLGINIAPLIKMINKSFEILHWIEVQYEKVDYEGYPESTIFKTTILNLCSTRHMACYTEDLVEGISHNIDGNLYVKETRICVS